MRSYFTSPIGFIFVGVFMLLSGIFFGVTMFLNMPYSMTDMLLPCLLLLILLTPIATMRLLAEERANKTDQLLLTAPVKVSGIVLGKYFAALSVFLTAIATTLFYLAISVIFGSVAWGEVITTYISAILIGGLLISIGLFISSLTESQIVAAVATYGAILLLFFSVIISPQNEIFSAALRYIQIIYWEERLRIGVISLSDIVYHVSFTALFLLLTVRRVESRRWK